MPETPKKKIAFFDIDGTLLPLGESNLRPRVLEALNLLKAQGIKIFLSTGRTPQILPRFPGVTFDGAVCFNGGYCFDQTGILFHSPLHKEDMRRVIENAKAEGISCLAATVNRMGSNFYTQSIEDYMQISHNSSNVLSPKDFEALLEEDIYQLMVGCTEDQDKAMVKGAPHLKSVRWWDRATDVIDINCSKAHGIEMVLQSYGLTKEDAMAFGDGDNDIDMLSYCSLGIAMGNAREEVKRAADYITDSCEDDGVYTALHHFGYL